MSPDEVLLTEKKQKFARVCSRFVDGDAFALLTSGVGRLQREGFDYSRPACDRGF